jgi:HK97 family phage prohead protease
MIEEMHNPVKETSKRELPENYRPALESDVPEGRACGNCFFYDEERVSEEGDKAWCNKWEDFVRGDYYCNAWESDESENRAEADELSVGDFVRWNASGGIARGRIVSIERDGKINVPNTDFEITGEPDNPAALIAIWREGEDGWEETSVRVGHKFSTLTKIDSLRSEVFESREVNLTAPSYMRAAARQGLKYYEEGLGGDGLVSRTISEARAMARGSVTADKWVRIRAWIARHLVDLDSPAANPSSEDYPSPGVVAHLLWGSGPSKRAAQRALAYAEGVVARIEEENEGRAKGEALSKIETRTHSTEFELREDETGGMLFEGYAAVFNSESEPLPFIERIAPGAFRGSLKQRNDIKILWNHDTGAILGSTRAGTLQLYEDDRGLKVRAQLPNTTLGRDTAELLRRGDVNAMSFGFSVPKNGDSWNSEGTERTLNQVRLHEVSIVAFPAYTATAGTATVRGLDKIAKRADVDADQLADALLKIESGQTMSLEEKSLITKVLDTLAPEATQSADEFDGQAWLQLKKKKLETLIKKA